MASGVIFSHLMEEYGNLEAEADANNHPSTKRKVKKGVDADDSTEEGGPKKNSNMALIQTEERNTGAVTWAVYQKYLGFAGGMIWAPIIVLLLMLTQGAQGVFLFFWHLIYAGLNHLQLAALYSLGSGPRRAFMVSSKAIIWRFMPVWVHITWPFDKNLF
jgi:hypothetical protein